MMSSSSIIYSDQDLEVEWGAEYGDRYQDGKSTDADGVIVISEVDEEKPMNG